jgi:starch synthase
VEFLQNLSLTLGAHHYEVSVHQARVPGFPAETAPTVYLIDCPALFDRPALYSDAADEHLRFLVLSRAALESCQRMAFAPHIVHCHDWHTGFLPLYLKTTYAWDRLFAETRSVLTIHNLGYQGVFPASQVANLELGGAASQLHQDDLRAGQINSLKHGLIYADLVTTVSPTYAREICTPAQGMGLDAVLRARGEAVVGILNGVDYAEWSPETDRYVPFRFSAQDLTGKQQARDALLARLGLVARRGTALIGLVSRLTWQKGIDLLFDALPHLLTARDVCLAVVGNGEARYEEFFTNLQRSFPERVAFHQGYSEELAHWIEAASDMFLMPSRYEPCGLNQMYSLRYGTVPIVRRTGGLADSVQHYDAQTGQGTGIVFEHEDGLAVEWALTTALDLFRNKRIWNRLVRNGMAQDFSWPRQGERYIEQYLRLLSA